MEQLTITDTIEVADLSVPLAANYQSNGDLFGHRKAVTAPPTIALVADALRWQYESFPDIPYVAAVGTITIDSNTDGWNSIEIFVNDPYLGVISFGKSYPNSPGESPASIAATLAINSGVIAQGYNYNVYNDISAPTVVYVTAPLTYGAAINGDNRLSVEIL
jgi:hypothetical protein